MLGWSGGSGTEDDIVVDRIEHRFIRDGKDGEASIEIVANDLVGGELVIGDVAETQIRSTLALDADVVAIDDAHRRNSFYPPELISDDLSEATAAEQATKMTGLR